MIELVFHATKKHEQSVAEPVAEHSKAIYLALKNCDRCVFLLVKDEDYRWKPFDLGWEQPFQYGFTSRQNAIDAALLRDLRVFHLGASMNQLARFLITLQTPNFFPPESTESG